MNISRRIQRGPVAAVDIGTANTKVFLRDEGIVASVPTVVAQRMGPGGKQEVVFGAEAAKFEARCPDGTEVVRPIVNGKVVNYRSLELFLSAMLNSVLGRSLVKPRLLISIRGLDTTTEKQAVRDTLKAAGAKDVRIINMALAGAIGAGLPITEPVANMLVDIGAGRCDASIISLKQVVASSRSNAAGNSMDSAISGWLKRENRFFCGPHVPEQLKIQVGGARPMDTRYRTLIRGHDLGNGAPREKSIGSVDVAAAIGPVVTELTRTVVESFSNLNAELAADLVDRGILLVGGGASLRGIAGVLRTVTGLPVMRAQQSENAAIIGLGALLSEPALLGGITEGL